MNRQEIKRCLTLAGASNQYQILLILFLSILWVVLGFVMIGPTLIYMNPEFQCKGSEDSVTEVESCPRLDTCTLVNDFTIVSELKLYCQKQWERNLIQSMIGLGAMFGLLIMNIVSDTHGRRFAFIVSLSLLNLCIILTVLGASFSVSEMLIVSQFLGGFAANSLITLSYVMFVELCDSNLASKAIVTVNAAFGISTSALGIFYDLSVHWFDFLAYFALAPSVLMTLILSFYLVESPYFLNVRGQNKRAETSVLKIAEFNGKSQSNCQQIRQIFSECEVQKSLPENIKKQRIGLCENLKKMYSVLSRKQYAKQILILTTIYTTANLNFYGISFAFGTEGAGFGLNSIIAGLIEISSILYLGYFVNQLKRRAGIALGYGMSLLVGLLFLSESVEGNNVTQTCLLSLSRVFSTIGYSLVACSQVESFPEQIRSIAAGFVEALSLSGGLLAPFVVDLSKNIGISPIVSISVFLNFAIWPCYFLRETLMVSPKQKEIEEKDHCVEDSTFCPSDDIAKNTTQQSTHQNL